MASASSTPSSSSPSSFKVYTLGPDDTTYKRYITKQLIPLLVPSAYKGQMGRVGVVGGSPDYTGAPYYAAQSALKFGADLSFVFCAKEAAVPIKTYSPELMVTSFYEEDAVVNAAAAAGGNNATAGNDSTCSSSSTEEEALAQRMADKVAAFLPRLHALVIGPGLGRDPVVLRAVALLIARAREAALPLVVDADGLWLVAQDLDTVRGYARCVLTPNAVEFDRLLAAAGVAVGVGKHRDAAAVHALSVALGGVTVVKKGAVDVVSAGAGAVFVVAEPGSMRRCGGQGDILAGSLGVAVHWTSSKERAGALDAAEVLAALPCDAVGADKDDPSCSGSGGSGSVPHTMWAAALAAAVTKRAGARAFNRHQRAMTSPDVLLEIGPAFQDFCGESEREGGGV